MTVFVVSAPVAEFGIARAGSVASGVKIALMPAGQTVSPGSDFYLDLVVTEPSEPYNAWEATLVFDPAALTYVPVVPTSAQQGCLMTGDCSNACGSTFLQLKHGQDSVYVIDGITCFQTFISAPGQLFRLHFRASTTTQQTNVSLRNLRFADGVRYLSPVTSSAAQIGIGQPVTAVDPGSSSAGLRLSAAPNPARGSVTFALASELSGEQEIAVHDVQGRTVRVLTRSWQAAGARQIVWDGRNEFGSRLAPGVYLVTLRVGNRRTQSHVTLLE